MLEKDWALQHEMQVESWIPGQHEVMINNSMHSNHYFGDDSCVRENEGVARVPAVVKFEIQVFLLYHFLCECTTLDANESVF